MTAAPQQRPSKPGVFGTVLSVMFTLLFAAVISVVLEWGGMVLVWPDQGVDHSRFMLADHINYLNEDFKDTVLGFSPIVFVAQSFQIVRQSHHVIGFQAWVFQLSQHSATAVIGVSAIAVAHWLEAAFNTLAVFFIRLVILMLALSRISLYLVLALIYGLVRRDIRRISGGREYGFRYHRIKPYTKWSIGLFVISYLSVPVSIHPNWFLLPLAVVFPLMVLFLSSTFQKYI